MSVGEFLHDAGHSAYTEDRQSNPKYKSAGGSQARQGLWTADTPGANSRTGGLAPLGKRFK